jgi:MOSC domain-containing protein YiiM
MSKSALYVTAAELEAQLAVVIASPCEVGRLEAIVVRPATNERNVLETATLTPEGGIGGDRWVDDSFYRLEDGGPDPRCQVSLMNARILRQVAGEEDAMCLAGDNLIVDFDLSETNLPAGCQLEIGGQVIVEITDLAHTGCSKFARRYGDEARKFVNNTRGKALHLRGRYARITRGGEVRVGDPVLKLGPK